MVRTTLDLAYEKHRAQWPRVAEVLRAAMEFAAERDLGGSMPVVCLYVAAEDALDPPGWSIQLCVMETRADHDAIVADWCEAFPGSTVDVHRLYTRPRHGKRTVLMWRPK